MPGRLSARQAGAASADGAPFAAGRLVVRSRARRRLGIAKRPVDPRSPAPFAPARARPLRRFPRRSQRLASLRGRAVRPDSDRMSTG